ncbi:ketopantoate reductase family protein [Sunxiuqinia elliptica]|uniref:2-dehydropantoate 2-reductase n=1 Tax=Sunxiuqinia elliptica TaxID=655355 RepID=A0A1I2MDI5_9BACT|nr:2-dehydropantoate 2-reductase [Sunxiuqinia elliptica]SFF89523.1 2-dehydropantoate 2-reductase [Sunxiuqinia elliptica]
MKIGILGIGGIGGFIGGKLAKHFGNDSETEIIFICRGKTKDKIAENGLVLNSNGERSQVHPDLLSENPAEIGQLDVLIVATKAYSLGQVIKQYQACLTDETVVIPLQNGVNAKEIVLQSLDGVKPTILEGCIYIASNIGEPGVVNHVGGPGKIFFGNTNSDNFSWLEKLMKEGGLDANYTKAITKFLWKKFLFVSPVAAMTTALNLTFGAVAENAELMSQLEDMMKEVQQLALQLRVDLSDQDVADSLNMIQNFPYQAKSSLQLDFENESTKNEKYYLVDYVIEEAKKCGVLVPDYELMNGKIQALV